MSSPRRVKLPHVPELKAVCACCCTLPADYGTHAALDCTPAVLCMAAIVHWHNCPPVYDQKAVVAECGGVLVQEDDDEEEEVASPKAVNVDSTASSADEPVTITFGGDGSTSFGGQSGASAGVIPDSDDAKDEL